MKLSKWKIELVVLALIAMSVAGIWWFMSTADERAREAQYDQLVDYANRQTVEIAILEQAAELKRLKEAMQKPKLAPPPTGPIIIKPEKADVDAD